MDRNRGRGVRTKDTLLPPGLMVEPSSLMLRAWVEEDNGDRDVEIESSSTF